MWAEAGVRIRLAGGVEAGDLVASGREDGGCCWQARGIAG